MSSHPDDTGLNLAQAKSSGPFQRVANVLAAIGTVWIFLLMFLIMADVIGRNFFNSPITGVAEFAGRSVVAIVFLQLGAAIGTGRMTQAEFLLQIMDRHAPRLRNVLEVFYALVATLLFALLTYIAWPEFVIAWQSDEFFGVRGVYTVATWPFKGLIVIGSAMASVAYLLTVPALWRRVPRAEAVSK
ncbi:MAG TPA: TRAP transporter small permease [Gammaproteobacteria bacterium]|nr:TRAP transporter small permease [Gammaproteobacteria bacterium]